VLLVRLPYDKNLPLFAALLDPVGVARRGFIVVVQDTRGRFASDGEWDPWTCEADDGYDTVRWAAALPGSNGSVGMFGASYFAHTAWMAALTKPPELKAISPRIAWSDPDDGLFARGGAYELGIDVPWSLVQGIDTLMRRHPEDPAALGQALVPLIGDLDAVSDETYWELPTGPHPVFQRHGIQEIGFNRSRRDPDWSAAACCVAGRQAEIQIPSLHTGGWYDIFCQGTLDNYAATHAGGHPANLIMGPWSHLGTTGYLGDVNFGAAANIDVMGFRGRFADLELDWLRRWLAPEEDAPPRPELPPVLIFVMGINQWREELEWPLTRAVGTDLFLRAGGLLSFDAPENDDRIDTFTYDPEDPVPTTGGALLMSNEYRPGPLDQARVEARPDVLVYTTQPLTADLEVTGRIRAHLTAATDAPTTDWIVRLCDVDTDGVSWNIQDGIVRVVAPPDQFAEQVIDLWSTSYVFRAGHRIRVQVTSSNFPRWDRNLNTGEPTGEGSRSRRARQQIAHDADRPSRVVLPVIPAQSEAH
jgi:uncharacterized protein